MRFSTIVAALLPVGLAFAQTSHTVLVGQNGTLTFSPSSIQIQNGDTVSFQFLSKNHTVTQSTFANPCSPITNPDGSPGVDSGFQPVPANATEFQQFSFTINNASAPLWFYCKQANHCQQGMVFAINPTAEKSFDAFQKAAMASTPTTGGAAPSASGASGSPSASGSAGGASPSASAITSGTSSGATPDSSSVAGNANGAGSIKAGGAAGLLVAGIALVAGTIL
ncbi:hypothetical protein K474DRAFT_1629274 [Panus rudis PR-1116 ss-1]|nr:hypothetical protein K474DRAFT_1629274 [Panus rudis PR-1116 ss-1]